MLYDDNDTLRFHARPPLSLSFSLPLPPDFLQFHIEDTRESGVTSGSPTGGTIRSSARSFALFARAFAEIDLTWQKAQKAWAHRARDIAVRRGTKKGCSREGRAHDEISEWNGDGIGRLVHSSSRYLDRINSNERKGNVTKKRRRKRILNYFEELIGNLLV